MSEQHEAEPVSPPIDARPHDPIRAALHAGEPVFIATRLGAVIGLQPLTSTAPATIMTIAARLPDSEVAVPGGEVTYPAREFVVVTNLRSIGPLPDQQEHCWARIDEVTLSDDGNVLIPDVSRFHAPVITRYADHEIGTGGELAQRWQAQLSAHRNTDVHDWTDLVTAQLEVLLDAHGRLLSVHQTPDGELVVTDITASEQARRLVLYSPATVQVDAWELVVTTPTSTFRSGPIVEIADAADPAHPLVVEYLTRESAVLHRYVRIRFAPRGEGPELARGIDTP